MELSGFRCARSESTFMPPAFENLESRLLLSLLGIGAEILPPDIYYDATGVINYSAAQDAFNGTATPLSIALTQGGRPISIKTPRDFQLHIIVDQNGNLTGGTTGPDLSISGNIDVNRDNINEYSGVLLTGEIVQFGYLNVGATDRYDFRFHPTGGALISFFTNKDIGLDMSSINSTFNGSFTVDFTGGSQGVLGVIEPLGSLAGQVMFNGQTGLNGVTVGLTGTDIHGAPVNMTAVTANIGEVDGSYVFANLTAGTYAITEIQPAGFLDGNETAGSLGGTVGNDVISQITVNGGAAGTGYNFGEVSIPTAIAQSVSGQEDQALPVALGGSDAVGATLTFAIVSGPTHGTLSLEGNLATYTPSADYNGPDGFTFTVTNSFGGTRSPAAVDISIAAVNDAPVANADSAATAEDTAVVLNVLANDADVDGDVLTVTGVTAPTHGAALLNADGSITYTPSANYNGPDSFSYVISDGNGGTATAQVDITVAPVNDAPVANGQSVSTTEGTPVAITLSGSDIETPGDQLTFTIVTAPAHGTLCLLGNQVTYTPGAYYSGADSFAYTATDNGDPVGSHGNDRTSAAATVNITVVETPKSSLGGKVFVDSNNNGLMDLNETGIAGVTVALTGVDHYGQAVSRTAVSDSGGMYVFVDLRPGVYQIVETQPAEFLDGNETAGSLGGIVGDDVISQITVNGGVAGTGYNFAELTPASLSGFTYVDYNNDGLIDFNEKVIEGVTVTLTGVDDRGQAVSRTAVSDSDGVYIFVDLRPGVYKIVETQPAGYIDGLESVGTLGGTVANDAFSNISLSQGIDGINYNFAEQPSSTGQVIAGQTATIGFWQNKNGQNLLKSLNGGANSTQLGHWLAATFPNIYGASAGDSNLAGKTNAQIADYYLTMFKAKAKQAGKGAIAGPAKFDCQVMSTAFAVYVTNLSLAGTTAASYGFLVTQTGVGTATFNIGTCGAAFGVANFTNMRVLDILMATDDQSTQGRLYDLNSLLQRLANDIYTAINEAGDIG